MRINLRAVIPALVIGSLAAIPSFATSVTGSANIAGSVSVGATFIDFSNPFTVPNTIPPAMQTGSFVGLTGGTIMSLSGGPLTGAVSVPDFITFSGGLATPVLFDLTNINLGVGSVGGCGSNALGSECTLPGSPFTLIQVGPTAVVATLDLNGIAYTGASATGSSATDGTFTTQTNIVNYQTITQIVGILEAGGSIDGQTYSATFTATPSAVTPEPASLLLMGVGLLGAGIIARKKVRS